MAKAKAKGKAKATQVDKLRKAGLLHSKHRLTKKHEAQINRLTGTEVSALVRVIKKAGKSKPVGGSSRAWFV